MEKLTLLHTAEVHKATFDALRDRIAPDVELEHIVRPDWLDTARNDGISDALHQQIAESIAAAPNRVLCSCTSIGETAEKSGAVRIDRPMMEAAAAIEGPILLVYALESTAAPSRALLDEACDAVAHQGGVEMLFVEAAWPHFETGNTTQFYSEIAKAIRGALRLQPETASVVLAQASMASAANLLTDLPQTVLSSPETALRAALT